ncbi:alpha/beta fold hydrolase [Rhodopila sp.]|jgi:3-oxoadipate enol-lactonase|uniref:alpha/beta fold hydrolase n=1 Tax=Rhodopila sp. TaxID=2480087 RepID=UPI002CFC6C63|nr:alpha/beta hydrolase [Rhodopila sp.]HVZ09688.1 alpha/beta hydrolase [Rhodopila sp.]
MNWIEVNGTGLRWEESGSGPTTLVLVHEMGGTLDSWDRALGALNNSRRVLRYDTRGAGLSEKIRGGVTWDQMADDLKALLDATGHSGKVALAGIAVGAAIAAHFAVRYPDRAAALVLHGPAMGVADDRRQATLDRAAAVEAGGMRGVVETSLAASYPPVVRLDEAVFAQFRARWLGNDPESFAAINRMLAGESIEHELPRIACPALFTAGRHDSLRPPSVIRPMSERVPGAEFLELNTGHFASVQTPGVMGQAIHYFLHALGY